MSKKPPRKLDYASSSGNHLPPSVVAMQIAIVSVGCTLIALIILVLAGS